MTKELMETESDLVKEILEGNKEKYELIIRKYNQRLYRIAKSILWDETEIEDVMQEAYIKAYQQLPKFENRSAFGTWLTRILINECLMKTRKDKNKALDPLTENLAKQSNEIMNPEKMIVNKELKSLLESAIAQLPEKYRMVFVMREIENMSVAETTKTLDITDTNVKARLSRAKEMLRNSLLNNYPINELLDFNLVRCDRIVKNVFAKI